MKTKFFFALQYIQYIQYISVFKQKKCTWLSWFQPGQSELSVLSMRGQSLEPCGHFFTTSGHSKGGGKGHF